MIRKDFFLSFHKSFISFCRKYSMIKVSIGSFHVKWSKFSKVGTWPISDSDETFPDERYIWDQIMLNISAQTDKNSKIMRPQSWHGKLKIDNTRGRQESWLYFWVTITFLVLTSKFWNLLHCFCAWRTLR